MFVKSMQEKVLLISPECPACDLVKKALAKRGLIGNFQVIDVSTAEGADFAKRLGVNGVPECAVIEGDGRQKTVRICTTEEWQRMLQGE